jgi:hypothetical protein
MKEEDKNIIVKITTSGDDHCGNSCPYIEIDTYKKISLDSDEEIDTGIYYAKCNLYKEELGLNKKRKYFPWKRCVKCKESKCSELYNDCYWD